MIQFNEIGLLRGTKQLLQQTSARIYPGHKVGLIGSNGCGKSSLFAMLMGKLSADQGDMLLPKEWVIASVAQETPASDRSAMEYVLDGDRRFRQLQAELAVAEQAHNGERIAVLYQKLEDVGAYDIEARTAIILAGLGFSEEQMCLSVKSFSGGWRMRLNLAQALIIRSDLMLLDEPTNHLDLDAVIWLEKWLQRYSGTLILISHDKSFLDNTIEHILSIEQQQLMSYSGGYSAYEIQRAERLRQQQIQYERQQEKSAHLQSFIDRFRAKASKAKQAQSRIKQLEKMEQLLPVHQQSGFSFEFPPPPKLPNPLVKIDKVKVGYGDKVILNNLQLNLVPGSRIGLLGRNGAGKSTLIKLLAEEIAAMQGDYQASAGLRIGYFAQHQLEYLRGDDTPLAHLTRLDPKASEQSLRDFLGGFGFKGEEALSPVAPMSGGEKARLVLALVVYQKPNLLLLDEPTNHLDLDMRHALNMALQGFTGAMVLVSHDRFLLSSVCEEFYLVDKGNAAPFPGDLDDYRQYLMNHTDDTGTAPKAPKISQDKKVTKRLEAEFRQQTKPLRQRITKFETQMDKCQAELDRLAPILSDADLYSAENKSKLTELLKKQAHSKSELEESELQWLELQEELEHLQKVFEQSVES